MRRAVLLVVGPDMYGLSRTALQIAAAAAGELEVELWSASEGPLLAEARARGLTTRVVPLPVLRRQEVLSARFPLTVARLLLSASRLWRLARQQRSQLALVHALGAPSLGGLVVARAAGCPLVWSVHEVFGSATEARAFGSLLARADARVACSQYVARQFGPATGDFTVIYSGADVEETAPSPHARPGTRLICVGRLNRWKGQDVLLRAFSALPESLRRSTTLQVVGSAFEGDAAVADELEALRRALGLEDSVQMLGERADARELMAQADVVVVPSQKPEPFGKVVIEGMALGRAVIATTPGGPAEVITDGVDGLLVHVGDTAGLTRAIERLCTRPDEAQRLGREARRTASRFTGTAAGEQYRDVYRGVVA